MTVFFRHPFLLASVLLLTLGIGYATATDTAPVRAYSRAAPGTAPDLSLSSEEKRIEVVDAAIIQPFRSATVGSEVSGIIEAFHFEEGQLVKEGQVVVEISKKRYTANAEKVRDRVKSLGLALKRAKREAAMKQELLAKGASTQQEVLRANASVEIAEAEIAETRQLLKLAELDLKSCEVRSPFTGYVNLRHKHEHEPVERLQPLFDLVDNDKVYAVANVPEPSLAIFRTSRPAFFASPQGKRFKGVISKATKSIDPKSKTRRIYLLIPNTAGELEIGMSGSLEGVRTSDRR
jgi:RND family efflux transporter MFP subunit